MAFEVKQSIHQNHTDTFGHFDKILDFAMSLCRLLLGVQKH